MKHLFSPGKIGTMEIKNRIVMTAMGNHLASNDGSISDDTIAFYVQRAKGGVGLIVTECVIVDYERGKGNMRQLAASDDRYIAGLKELADKVHAAGAKIVAQIYHPGRQGISAINSNLPMAAPSEVECQAVHQPVYALSIPQIQSMVERFAQASRRIKEAGFDGVEVHGAHGYLVTQFLSPYTNHRTDSYGGDTSKRLRFLEEIIAGIRRECGKNYPLLIRLTVDEFLGAIGKPGEGLVLEEGVTIAKRLEELGVDALDISCGIYETMNTSWEPISFEQGWKSHLAATVKSNVRIPVIGASVIRDPLFAENLLAEGKLDFVGSARQHYADPQWAEKAASGRSNEIRRCISCLYCMQMLMEADITGAQVGCSVNIQSGKEKSLTAPNPNGDGRVVAIIGAGPAGLEAARILALRNFKPVVFEKKSTLGGQLYYASRPPGKSKISWLIEYLNIQMHYLGVELKLQKVPTLSDLKNLNPYAVFVAQGSEPIWPNSIPGLNGPNIYTPWQILDGEAKLAGPKTVVVGSGLTGIETSLYLANKGQKVSVYEMASEIGPGIFFQNLIDTLEHLKPFNVELSPNQRLVKIEGKKAVFEQVENKAVTEVPFDDLVLALGAKPKTDLVEEIKGAFERVSVIGDASTAGRIRHAMASGFHAAWKL
jgi:2,4-dienoyl-CoA reductase-like NADH-dependent reductase (Old Yellow Enzyme family)/thioredoxin reductase